MSKVILVTGASGGIGKAIARACASAGHNVYGTSRKATPWQSFENFQLLPMEVTDENSVREAIRLILEKHGRIDVVVNNAGSGFNGAAEDVSNEEVEGNFRLNVVGAWNVCRAVLPAMRSQQGGYILAVSSFAGQIGLPFRSVYAASKHALEGMMESLSIEVRRWNIKVVIVQPAEFSTGIIENRGNAANISATYRSDFDRINQQINEGVRHAAPPDEMGEVVLRIINHASPKLRYRVAP
ncbi:MAG: SDR family oxidoreductase, partial [Flavobacteriales bacterium]|nr:SDR family oxidoreductase [Flavobacteriales bacterium]